MATIYYIRERLKQGNITSSREVSVADLISLYGAEAAGYEYVEVPGSPDSDTGLGRAATGPDPARVIVKIETGEAGGDTFPAAGFYRVRDSGS